MELGVFFSSGLVLGGLAGGLSLILILAEKYIADYGTCQVNINDDPERSFECEGGKNLLLALADQKIFIPSACGGKGTCGYCKVQIQEGGGPVLPTEKGLLTRPEIRSNMRLSCQLKIKNDMKLHIPDELLAVQEFTCECEKIEALTHDTKLVRFRLLEPREISFKPGQYCQITVPQDYLLTLNPPVFDPVFRAYSIASIPKYDNILEFIIRLVPGGICTTWVHTALSEGQQIRITGPYGEFYLREESDRPIICVGGGSGIAPIRSIVEHLFDRGTQRQVYCFIGQRSVKDLYWHQENLERARQHDNFVYVPALSDLGEDEEWDGETGFIHNVIDRRIEDASETECYLCGPPVMIDAAIETLKEKNLPEERALFDKF